MRALIIVLSILFTTVAKGNKATDVCEKSTDKCFILYEDVNKRPTLFLPAELYNGMSVEDKLTFAQTGTSIQLQTDAVVQGVSGFIQHAFVDSMNSTTEEGEAFVEKVLTCGFSIASIKATLGASYWAARFTCAGAGVSCAYSIIAYDRWQARLKRDVEEQKAIELEKAAERANPTSERSRGLQPKVVTKCRYTQISIDEKSGPKQKVCWTTLQ